MTLGTRGDGRPFEWVVRVLLLILGIQLCLLLAAGQLPPNRQVTGAILFAAALGVILALPPVRRRVEALADRFCSPSPLRRGLLAAGVFVVSIAYLYFTAVHQGRTFTLKYQDEFSYAIQAQMIARGTLWLPPHPLAEFFASFQLVASPVYASIYFPGAAILYAPAVWLGVPTWVIPLILSGLTATLLFLVIAETLDDLAGLLAVVMLLSLTIFRLQSIMLMAQIPTLVLGLGMIWCWLRWRVSQRPAGWTMLLAALFGWATITRPVDALCFGIPVALAAGIDLWRACVRPARVVCHAVLAAVALLPFMALQLAFNRGVTGSFFKTPFTFYADQYFPGTRYGFGPPVLPPDRGVGPIRDYWDSEVRPLLPEHKPWPAAIRWMGQRLPATLRLGVPHAILFVLLPVGLFGLLRNPATAVVAAPLLLFPVLYWPYAFFLPHYTLTAAPAVLCLLLVGARIVSETVTIWRMPVRSFLTLSMLGISLVELPEFNRTNADEFFPATHLSEIDQKLRDGIPPRERAIVLFRFAQGANPQEEPVYNAAVAWPDDARIIRAHDRGGNNARLFHYYADRQPERVVYLFDRGTGRLIRLGKVTDLASAPIMQP